MLWRNVSMVSIGFAAIYSQLLPMPWPAPAPSDSHGEACPGAASAGQCICIGGGTYLGDGIQADASFHQHGAELLDGSYGAGLVSAIMSILPLPMGTAWQLPSEQLSVLASVILDGQRWMIFPTGVQGGNRWGWSVVGRDKTTVSGGSTGARAGFPASQIGALGKLLPARAAEFEAFADALALGAGDSTTPLRLEQLLQGNRGYWNSDYMVHRRPTWAASVHMRSNRTIAARCVNSQGKLAAEEGNGEVFLYQVESPDAGSAYDGIWPVINWQQLPGITCEQNPSLFVTNDPCDWKFSYARSPTFVGSVSDNCSGTAAAVLESHNVTANRSWHFFDDLYVSIVSGVSLASASTAPVYTTIASTRNLSSVASVLLTNGSIVHLVNGGNASFAASAVTAVHHGQTAYRAGPLDDGDGNPSDGWLHVSLQTLAGNWDRIGVTNKSASATVFSLAYEHATTTAAASAAVDQTHPASSAPASARLADLAYVVFPNTATIEDAAVLAIQPGLTLGYTADGCHWAHDSSSDTLQAACFAAGTLPGSSTGASYNVIVNDPLLLHVRAHNDTGLVAVTVSNPDRPGLVTEVKLSICSAPLRFVLPDGAFTGQSVTLPCMRS